MKAIASRLTGIAFVLAALLAACQPKETVSASKAASLADADAQTALDASTSRATEFDAREYRLIRPSSKGAFAAAAAAAANPGGATLAERDQRLLVGSASQDAVVMRPPQSAIEPGSKR